MQILLKGTYVGRIADAWSAGVALYALLNGSFPFARAEDNCENEVIYSTLSRCKCGGSEFNGSRCQFSLRHGYMASPHCASLLITTSPCHAKLTVCPSLRLPSQLHDDGVRSSEVWSVCRHDKRACGRTN